MTDIATRENIFTSWSRQPPSSWNMARGEDLHLMRKIQKIKESRRNDPGAEIAFYWFSYRRSFLRWSTLLPDEIIVHIFEQGTFRSPENDRAPLMPLVYASVCKRWRYLALSATFLWGLITLADYEPYNLTKLFLARSKSAPLFIEINLADKRFDPGDNELWLPVNEVTDRLALFLPHAHRWRSFECYVDHWVPMRATLHALHNLATPILKTLILQQTWDVSQIEPSSGEPIMILQGGAPALQQLHLCTLPRVEWRNVAFTNLSDLVLHDLRENETPSFRVFWSLLFHSPNLKKLSLVGQGPPMDLEAAYKLHRVNLLSLEEFRFEGTFSRLDDALEVAHPLDYVLFILSSFMPGPALHSLTIGRFKPDDDILRVVPLLHNFAHVKRLGLNYINFTPETATQWLFEMPEVCHLTIFAHEDTVAGVIGALVAEPSLPRNILCPSLATFQLDSRYPSLLEYEIILDLVQERLDHGLKTLVFDINSKKCTLAALDLLKEKVEIRFEGRLFADWWQGPDFTELFPEGMPHGYKSDSDSADSDAMDSDITDSDAVEE